MRTRIHDLTLGQYRISALIACGKSAKEIACLLNANQSTIETTIKTIRKQLKLGKQSELAGWWINTHFELNIDFNQLIDTFSNSKASNGFYSK